MHACMDVSPTIKWFCYHFSPMNWSMPKLSVTEWNDTKAHIRNIYGNNFGQSENVFGTKVKCSRVLDGLKIFKFIVNVEILFYIMYIPASIKYYVPSRN